MSVYTVQHPYLMGTQNFALKNKTSRANRSITFQQGCMNFICEFLICEQKLKIRKKALLFLISAHGHTPLLKTSQIRCAPS